MAEEKILTYPNSIETRVALVEMSIVNINQTLIRLETKIDKGFEELRADGKAIRNDMNGNYAELRKELKSDFRWLLTIIVGLGAIMAHGFHWF